MVPAKPLPRLMPVTSTRVPAGSDSTVISWPTSNPSIVVEPQLDQPHAGLHAGLGVVAGGGLVELLRVAVTLGHLERGVSVAFGRLDLDDAHGLDTEDRDGDDLVVHPLLRHPDLLAENHCLCHFGRSLS